MRLVRANDALVPSLLEKQEQRTDHRWLGGLPDSYGIHTPGGTASLIRTLAAAYCAPESRYKTGPYYQPAPAASSRADGGTQLRGALPRMDGLNVYVTGFTPFRTCFTIT